MKRFSILTLMLIALVSGVHAQTTVFNNPDNHPFWGIRVGYDHTFPGNWHANNVSFKMFNSGPGISVGAIYNIPLVANLFFEPGLSFYYDTYAFDDLLVADPGDITSAIINPKIKKTGFRIPLTVGYHFDFTDKGKINVFTGPEVGLGTTAYETYTSSDTKYKNNLYDKEDGYFRRYDVAWRIGAGVCVGRWQIDISGAFGLVDLNPTDISYKENRLVLSLGYNF